MPNNQTDLQIIAYYATFLSPKRQKHSWRYKKETCPNGEVPFIISESLYYSSTAAWAAANLAIGTLNGEQLA